MKELTKQTVSECANFKRPGLCVFGGCCKVLANLKCDWFDRAVKPALEKAGKSK